MNILHYTLGVPPVRSGGLVNIVLQIAIEQTKDNNTIVLLWPGEISRSKKTKIVKEKEVFGIESYRIVNPLPVTIMDGISEPKYLVERKDAYQFVELLKKNNIEVLHIHTFMGLPLEYLIEAKKIGIKIFFTTHDYYGLCPKTILFNDKNCDKDNKNCGKCLSSSPSFKKVLLKQSRIYFLLRKCIPKKILYFLKNDKGNESKEINQKDILTMEKYYNEMFGLIDCFHFNSFISKMVYEERLGNIRGKVIPLFANIRKQRECVSYHTKINIGFIGGNGKYKGLDNLIKQVKLSKNENIVLHIFGIKRNEKFILCHPPYKYAEIKDVICKLDVIVIPSLWKETFGLGTVEAFSFNRPVIVSDFVGSKMLVSDNNGWVYSCDSELKSILAGLNIKDIIDKSNFIKENYSYNVKKFLGEIYQMYKEG